MKLSQQLVVFMFGLCVGHSALAGDEIGNMVITVTVERESSGENAYIDKLIAGEEEQASGVSGPHDAYAHANEQGMHEPDAAKEPDVAETRPYIHMRVLPEK